MHLDQRPQTLLRLTINTIKRFSFNKLRMIPLPGHEGSISVINPRQSARHTRPKIHPNLTQHRHKAAGHVLATMIANTLNNSHSARIPNRKPLTGPPGSKQLPSRSTIQRHIAQNHMLTTILRRQPTGLNNNLAAG